MLYHPRGVRGLSPVIATVVLVGITVVLAVMVFHAVSAFSPPDPHQHVSVGVEQEVVSDSPWEFGVSVQLLAQNDDVEVIVRTEDGREETLSMVGESVFIDDLEVGDSVSVTVEHGEGEFHVEDFKVEEIPACDDDDKGHGNECDETDDDNPGEQSHDRDDDDDAGNGGGQGNGHDGGGPPGQE